ncbi:MAG: cytochrome P450 [Xenococcaceae cyanobacterium]
MKLPDGPKSPSFIQLFFWIADPLNYLDTCAKRYGDIFTLRIAGFDPLIIISNPQAIQEIFNVDSKQFDAGRSNSIVRFLVGDNSLLLLDGDRHKRERKLLMPSFHGEKIKFYAKSICQITEKIASQWQVDRPFIARNVMQDITLEIILNAVFGLSSGDRYQQIKPLLAEVLDMTGSPLRASLLFLKFLQQDWGAWSPWGRMVQRQRKIDELLFAEIEQRRANSEQNGNDILSLMLGVRDEAGQSMSDRELRDEMITLLVAGHETTATALAWAFYWIHKLPEVRNKLLEELTSLGDNPDPMAIYQLPYLTAVCNEVLRMHPVIPITFPRIAKQAIKIMGYEFEAETQLTPSIYLVHYREDIYPEPHQFKPERFLDRTYSPSEFLPFGGGNRRCLGYALALLELKLVIGTILPRYELALASNSPVKAQRRGLTIAPSNGVPMVMVKKIEEQRSNRGREATGAEEQVVSSN